MFQGWSEDKDFYDVAYGKKMIPKQFNQALEKEGHEWGEFHARREQFILENAGKYIPQEVEIPQNIIGNTYHHTTVTTHPHPSTTII